VALKRPSAMTEKGAMTAVEVTALDVGDGPAGPLSAMPIEQLRAYRRALQSKECLVSYWRRLIQARLDLVGVESNGCTEQPGLSALLATRRVGAIRAALLSVHPGEGLPPLPELEALWDRPVPTALTVDTEPVLGELRDAERRLSALRRSLHARLDEATSELVARYHREPASCFDALPGKATHGDVVPARRPHPAS